MLLLLLPVSVSAAETYLVDDFETGLQGWEVQSFQGQTDYRIVAEPDGNRVLSAFSSNSASGLVHRVELDPSRYPYLSWRWKIRQSLKSGDFSSKAGDDYAARIYVVFPHWFKPLSRTINYIWANRLPAGQARVNVYFKGAKMLAVRSGDRDAGVWQQERRNLVEDYRRLFGEDPPRIGAIAIMTDTDNTGEEAQAWYDELRLQAGD